MSESERRGPRRPAFFSPSALEAHGGAYDPTEQIHVAHETAAALVSLALVPAVLAQQYGTAILP